MTHGYAEREHKVVRKALNSSSTYKTNFYKDPSSWSQTEMNTSMFIHMLCFKNQNQSCPN